MDNIIQTYAPIPAASIGEAECSLCETFGPVFHTFLGSEKLCLECVTDQRIHDDAAAQLSEDIRRHFHGEPKPESLEDAVDEFICATRKAEGFLHRYCNECGTGLAKAA